MVYSNLPSYQDLLRSRFFETPRGRESGKADLLRIRGFSRVTPGDACQRCSGATGKQGAGSYGKEKKGGRMRGRSLWRWGQAYGLAFYAGFVAGEEKTTK